MSDGFGSAGSLANAAGPPGGNVVDPGTSDIISIITETAISLGVDPRLALAIAQQESGLNPDAIGDGGNSVGLFQLNIQGEGAGMSVAQREDPRTNARIALTEVAGVARAHPDWTPGQIAAAAQRPADRSGYANAVNAIYGDKQFQPQAGQTGNYTPTGAAAGGPQASQGAGKPDVPFNPNQDYPISAAQMTWLRQNAGQDLWMASNPELSKILGWIAQNNITDPNEITSLVAQTNWYKTHSADQRAWSQLYASDPQEAQREIRQQQVTIGQQAKQMGLNLTEDELDTLSINSKYYGWTPQEMQQALGAYINIGPSAQGGNVSPGGGIGQSINQLKADAGAQLVTITDGTLNQWATNIASGAATEDGFKAYVQTMAKSAFPTLTSQLDQGMTVSQVVDPYRQAIASTLELPVDAVNFMDPRYKKFLQQPVQGSGGGTDMQLAPIWQVEQQVKSDPTYGYQHTLGARNQAYDAVANLEKVMGKIA